MFKNYLTIAVRSLLKNRLYSAINIFGLAVGLASCILILLYVQYETSYDKWLPDAGRIYRVHARFDVAGRAPMIGASAPGPALPALMKDFAEIETGVRLNRQRPIIQRGADVERENVIIADPSFFDVFPLTMVAGNGPEAFKDASSVLLSETAARKYFGNASPLGQVMPMTFTYPPGPLQRDYKVAGVFKDLPLNSNLDIQILVPLNEADFEKMPYVLRSWVSTNGATYIKLKPGADIAHIAAALPEFERRSIPDFTMAGNTLKTSDALTLSVMGLTDLHLHSPPSFMSRPVGDARTVNTFAAVAVMILVIAGINFTNLATARATQRAREVALRKVLGAKRPNLIGQFLGESVLTALLAFVIALVLVAVSLPAYNAFLQHDLSFASLVGVLPYLALLTLVVGLGAGLYPALYLSKFLPARILKANKSAAAEGSGRLRSALVVVQFAISIGLLVCTAVVYGQTVYARTMDLGYDREGLMVLRGVFGDQNKALRKTLIEEIRKLPGVVAVTMSNDVPTDTNNSNNVFQIPGKPSDQPILIMEKAVDYDFFSTYRIPLLAGRYLDESHGGDDYSGTPEERVARGGNIILNVAALSRLGIATPQEAIGQQFRIAVGLEYLQKMTTVTVVGVVGDFFYRSVRDELSPTFFQRTESSFANITLRYAGVPRADIEQRARSVFRELAPQIPYRGEFIDTLVDGQYQREEAEATMFAVFSLLAIVIGCLGLYGLASFSAERRTKEIGIRKVLGARVRDLVRLLVWDFSKPVLVANAIAWPAAWFLMRDWLNGFQHRIDLSPAIFAVAGIAALLIAWVTVASHASRAARANPIRALRYE